MRRNNYESGVIINATLDDTQIEAIVAKIKELITGNDGELKNTDLWGRKRLAYMIRKHKAGYYAFFRFEAPSEFILKLERMYKLEENILRFLTLKLDKYALGELEKQSANQTLKAEVIPDIPDLIPEAEIDIKEDEK